MCVFDSFSFCQKFISICVFRSLCFCQKFISMCVFCSLVFVKSQFKNVFSIVLVLFFSLGLVFKFLLSVSY